MYLVKTPWLISKFLFPKYQWQVAGREKKVYLTFDDGPHPEATTFVLEQLKKYNAKATFFCVGKNVIEQGGIYKKILLQGHAVGNHTHNHVNGWKVSDEVYFEDIRLASRYIDSRLFRPPYGRITAFQAKQLMETLSYKIVMWSVLSGDFDKNITVDQCYKNVVNASSPGSIIVFHDSEKAFPVMKYVLPKVLDYFKTNGYSCEKLGGD